MTTIIFTNTVAQIPSEGAITGTFVVSPGWNDEGISLRTPCEKASYKQYKIENISFEEYAKALTEATSPVVDLRPIQKANLEAKEAAPV